MTDTRKEYQDWLEKCPLTLFGGEFQVSEISWQACQQLNNNRIADLETTIRNMAAVIAKKDLYLGKIATEIVSIDKAEDAALEALAITADGVELVEVGVVACQTGKWFGIISTDALITKSVSANGKLYTIKKKG